MQDHKNSFSCYLLKFFNFQILIYRTIYCKLLRDQQDANSLNNWHILEKTIYSVAVKYSVLFRQTHPSLLIVCIYFFSPLYLAYQLGFSGGSDGKESPCNARDLASIPGLGRSSREGHGNPPQYSCLDNPHGQRNLVGYRVGHD